MNTSKKKRESICFNLGRKFLRVRLSFTLRRLQLIPEAHLAKLFNTLYQLVLIYQVDITEPIIKTQETLVRLKRSTLWVTRILFLQFPVWTTFYLSKSMFTNGNMLLLIIQVIVTIGFSYFAGWLFFNIKYENRNKRWFRLIFNGPEWAPLLKSMELLDQINDYKSPA